MSGGYTDHFDDTLPKVPVGPLPGMPDLPKGYVPTQFHFKVSPDLLRTLRPISQTKK